MTTRTKQHAKIVKELAAIQDQVVEKRKSLGEAVLADGDGSNAKITRLEGALSKLEVQEKSLQLALEAGQGAIEDSNDQATKAGFKKDEAEVGRISKLLNVAARGYIRRNYSDRDATEELIDLYNKAKTLTRKHDDKLNTISFHKAAQVIGAVRRTVVPVSRSIEVFAPGLVADAGEKRRF